MRLEKEGLPAYGTCASLYAACKLELSIGTHQSFNPNSRPNEQSRSSIRRRSKKFENLGMAPVNQCGPT